MIGRVFSGALLVALAASAADRPKRALPDPAAIKEATSHSPDPSDRWVSSRSLSHFLLAMLAKERGDVETVLAELRLAALYETQSPFPRYLLASELARRGEADAAEAELKEALAIDKGHGPSLMLLGRLEASRGRAGQAIDTLRRAAKANPEDPEPLALLVQAHLERREIEPALAAAERLDGLGTPKAARPAAQAFAEVADALAAAGDDDRAEALYRRASARDPVNAQRRVALGAFLEAHGRPKEAAEAYAEAFSPAHGEAQTAAAAARMFVAAGERARAATYVDVLRHLPDASSRHADDALLSIGYTFLEAGAPEEARRAFEGARDVAPDRAEAYHALGMALEAAGKFDKAEAAYAKVPSADALGLSARVHGAWCEHRTGKSAAAEGTLKELRLEHPANAEVALKLAQVLVDARRAAEAVEVLGKALGDAASPAIAAAEARILRKLGRLAEALSTLEQAHARWADDDEIGLAQAEAFAAAGRHAEAVERARAIVARRPREAAALDLLASELSREPAGLEEAESLARRALAEKPEKPSHLATLGTILVRRGKVDEGLAMVERAARAEAEPRVAALLAEARAAAGRTGEARKAFEKAIALAKAHGDAEAQEEAARGLAHLGDHAP